MIKIPKLNQLSTTILLQEMKNKRLRELQRALSCLGYTPGKIDGQYGPKTRNAWGEFKADFIQGDPTLVEPSSIKQLKKKLNKIKKISAANMSSKAATRDAIMDMCDTLGISLKAQKAYVLATVNWETNHTFKPVKEAYWLSENWRRNNLRYYPYYGRGFVQLTWITNYNKYKDILDEKLVSNPDLVMDKRISLFILVHGFKTGTFTGRKITEFINKNQTQYIKARRCINDSDKAREIKKIAERYLAKI